MGLKRRGHFSSNRRQRALIRARVMHVGPVHADPPAILSQSCFLLRLLLLFPLNLLHERLLACRWQLDAGLSLAAPLIARLKTAAATGGLRRAGLR